MGWDLARSHRQHLQDWKLFKWESIGGHIVAGLGAGLFAGGAHTLWVSEQSSGLGELVNGIIGSGLVFIGGIQVLVGEHIAAGNMHSTRRYKRKVVLE